MKFLGFKNMIFIFIMKSMKNGKCLKDRKKELNLIFQNPSSIVHEQTRCYTRIEAMR